PLLAACQHAELEESQRPRKPDLEQEKEQYEGKAHKKLSLREPECRLGHNGRQCIATSGFMTIFGANPAERGKMLTSLTSSSLQVPASPSMTSVTSPAVVSNFLRTI